VRIGVPDASAAVADAAAAGANLRRLDGKTVTVALDETTELPDIDVLLRALNGERVEGGPPQRMRAAPPTRGAAAERRSATRPAASRAAPSSCSSPSSTCTTASTRCCATSSAWRTAT